MTRFMTRAALVLALPLFAAAALAQPAPRRAAPDLPARIAALSSSLSLTADQQTRLAAVGSRYAGQTDSGAAWQAAADVQAVLTEAQIASLRTPRADGGRAGRPHARAMRRGGMDRGGMGRRGGPGRAPQSAEATAQREAVRAVRADFAPRAEALRTRLRAGQISAADFADAARALRADARQRLDATRTPEQRQRASEMRARREAATAARERALGITAQQTSALREIAAERVRLAPERVRLVPERGAERPDQDAIRARAEATRADRAALRTRAAAVFTPQQKAVAKIHRALVHTGRPARGHRGRR